MNSQPSYTALAFSKWPSFEPSPSSQLFNVTPVCFQPVQFSSGNAGKAGHSAIPGVWPPPPPPLEPPLDPPLDPPEELEPPDDPLLLPPELPVAGVDVLPVVLLDWPLEGVLLPDFPLLGALPGVEDLTFDGGV